MTNTLPSLTIVRRVKAPRGTVYAPAATSHEQGWNGLLDKLQRFIGANNI